MNPELGIVTNMASNPFLGAAFAGVGVKKSAPTKRSAVNKTNEKIAALEEKAGNSLKRVFFIICTTMIPFFPASGKEIYDTLALL